MNIMQITVRLFHKMKMLIKHANIIMFLSSFCKKPAACKIISICESTRNDPINVSLFPD